MNAPCFAHALPVGLAPSTAAVLRGRPRADGRASVETRVALQHKRRRLGPSMLAKIQKQKATESGLPEDDRPLDEILPPPQLPTLSTLTGDLVFERDDASSDEKGEGDDNDDADRDADEVELMQMGPGFQFSSSSPLGQYLNAVLQQYRLIEWPSFARVVRLTVIVVVTIVAATASIYTVDGLFYRISKAVFEDNV